MKKFINSIDTLLDESLLGFSKAHADIIQLNAQPHFIKRINPPKPGKVALISGGGSGHEPLHIGFVGTGMLDAACPGQIFTSPTPDQMLSAAQAAAHPALSRLGPDLLGPGFDDPRFLSAGAPRARSRGRSSRRAARRRAAWPG